MASAVPDKNPLDFYLWEHIKSLVYSFPSLSGENLCERILAGCETIGNMPEILGIN
jgi:hypothetical protein